MKCAIMQPTYLPWSGFFNLISNVDIFVFLDDVQFDRRSWQTRNRVLLNGNEILLSISTRKATRETLLKDIFIAHEPDWRQKHWQSLIQAYRKARYGKDVLGLLEEFFNGPPPILLAEFNRKIIEVISTNLGLGATFLLASDLACHGNRSSHLMEIAKKVGCDEYLSPCGSAGYLEQDSFPEISNLVLTFQDFHPQRYPQLGARDFVSHLSVIDVIANLGLRETREYIS